MSIRYPSSEIKYASPLSQNFSKTVLLTVIAACIAAGSGCKDRSAPDPNLSVPTKSDQPATTQQSLSNRNISDHPFKFEEVAARLGLEFTYRNGEDQNETTILESLGGGVGVIDYDRDGWDDLFCSGGGTFANKSITGHPSELFRNNVGNNFTPVAKHAGNGLATDYYSHGVFVADYNNDGFQDVLITGYGGLQLWSNQGDGTFTELHQQAELLDNHWSSAAGWGDFNNDGILDIYVAHYVNWSFDNHPFCQGPSADVRDICPPRMYEGVPDDLYISRGDGTFALATQDWNLRKDDSKGLGVLIADFDGNGFVDAYVANDTTNNYLYANSGTAPFDEIATVAGVAADKAGIPNGSMGVDLIDFNRDGNLDIWVTNYEREDFALYRNEGPRAFLHVSDIMGLNILGGLFVGFGTVCSDFDHDGFEDIAVNNGHVILYPTASPRKQRPVLMHSDGKRFRRVVFDESSYFSEAHDGRGLATLDFDHDGDLDMAFSNMNAPLALLVNETPKRGRWLQVRLVGRNANRTAIGSKVTIQCGDATITRVKKGGGSYMSTVQEALMFGLGEAESIDKITVSWPGGQESVLTGVTVDQELRIVEPEND